MLRSFLFRTLFSVSTVNAAETGFFGVINIMNATTSQRLSHNVKILHSSSCVSARFVHLSDCSEQIDTVFIRIRHR